MSKTGIFLLGNKRIILELIFVEAILQYAMNDYANIRGREFLICRTFRRVGDEIIEAARSFDLPDVKPNPLKIR